MKLLHNISKNRFSPSTPHILLPLHPRWPLSLSLSLPTWTHVPFSYIYINRSLVSEFQTEVSKRGPFLSETKSLSLNLAPKLLQTLNISLSLSPKMKNTPKNPNNPLKKKLAARFLTALNHLMTKNIPPSPPPSTAEKSRRHRAIRAAAYASMASSVGPRKAWSRALLKKIRSHKVVMMMNVHGKTKRIRRRERRRRKPTRFGHEGLKDLSEVVPGGEAMDSCKLLNESGHYIMCLRAQVQIMRQILDSSSSTIL